ncbi:MAG: hypothetical protein ACLQDY_00045 [Streptosporangiaceae bacterium]
MIIARFRAFAPLPAQAARRAVAEQALLVAALLALALVSFAADLPRRPAAAEIVLAVTAAAEWLIPYAGGGKLSLYRAEALVIVAVPLLRRLPAWLLAAAVAVAAWVALAMAPLFFSSALI